MKYDEYMDKECIPICDALNSLPDVETFESCCGHLKTRYAVYLKTKNLYSMSVIARVFDKRYSNTSVAWKTTIETLDAENNPQFCIGIYSERPFNDYREMSDDVKHLCDGIRYWSSERFYKHFKKQTFKNLKSCKKNICQKTT